MKSSRRPTIADPEHLTTAELLAAHERLFGRLEPQAKRRIEHIADHTPTDHRHSMDGLAA